MPISNIFNNFRVGKFKLQHQRQGVSKPTNDNKNHSRLNRPDADGHSKNYVGDRMGSSKSRQQKNLVDKNTGDEGPDQSGGGWKWTDKRNSRYDSHLDPSLNSPHHRAKSAPGVYWVQQHSPNAADRARAPYSVSRTQSRLFEDDGGRHSAISRRSPRFEEDNGRNSVLSRRSAHFHDYEDTISERGRGHSIEDPHRRSVNTPADAWGPGRPSRRPSATSHRQPSVIFVPPGGIRDDDDDYYDDDSAPPSPVAHPRSYVSSGSRGRIGSATTSYGYGRTRPRSSNSRPSVPLRSKTRPVLRRTPPSIHSNINRVAYAREASALSERNRARSARQRSISRSRSALSMTRRRSIGQVGGFSTESTVTRRKRVPASARSRTKPLTRRRPKQSKKGPNDYRPPWKSWNKTPGYFGPESASGILM